MDRYLSAANSVHSSHSNGPSIALGTYILAIVMGRVMLWVLAIPVSVGITRLSALYCIKTDSVCQNHSPIF